MLGVAFVGYWLNRGGGESECCNVGCGGNLIVVMWSVALWGFM